MKKPLFLVLAILISVAFVTSAIAAPKAKSEKSVSLTGEVVKNDGKMMTVKGPKGDESFDVSGVKNADKYKEGDKVKISYKEKDGKLTASSIGKPIVKGKTEKKEVKQTAQAPAPQQSAKASSK